MRPPSTSLRSALIANAVLSIFTGVIFTAFTNPAATLLGMANQGALRLGGVSLIVHAGILVWVRNRSTILSWTKINIVVIGSYPLLILALVLSNQITGQTGVLVATLDAAAVGAIAIWQFRSAQALNSYTGV